MVQEVNFELCLFRDWRGVRFLYFAVLFKKNFQKIIIITATDNEDETKFITYQSLSTLL